MAHADPAGPAVSEAAGLAVSAEVNPEASAAADPAVSAAADPAALAEAGPAGAAPEEDKTDNEGKSQMCFCLRFCSKPSSRRLISADFHWPGPILIFHVNYGILFSH